MSSWTSTAAPATVGALHAAPPQRRKSARHVAAPTATSSQRALGITLVVQHFDDLVAVGCLEHNLCDLTGSVTCRVVATHAELHSQECSRLVAGPGYEAAQSIDGKLVKAFALEARVVTAQLRVASLAAAGEVASQIVDRCVSHIARTARIRPDVTLGYGPEGLPANLSGRFSGYALTAVPHLALQRTAPVRL